MTGSIVEIGRDGFAEIVNTTAYDTLEVARQLPAEWRPIMDSVNQWVQRISTPSGSYGTGRIGSIIDRDKWLSPRSVPDKMRKAREAYVDDIVGNAADGSEAFALSRVALYADDEDEQDVWNQWAGDINLDDQLRKMWQRLFFDSQFVAATWWDHRSYTARGIRDVAPKRKAFDLIVPIGMTLIDTAKVIPVGLLMFGQQRLAYQATPMEAVRIERVLAKRDGWAIPSLPSRVRNAGRSVKRWMRIPTDEIRDAVELDDPIIEQMIVRAYNPNFEERRMLEDEGIDPTYLYELNPDMVFRHTLTKPDFNRFADVRMESVLELLDLKAQQRQKDRVVTVGGAHWILLIRKGSSDKHGTQPEIDALNAQATVMASTPVIVGDDRLQVDIITPSQDHTFDRGKWDNLDVRIFARTWSTFVPTGADRDDVLKTAKVIAKNLEGRRHMIRRTFEREVVDVMRRRNPSLTSRAKLVFTPANISLAFDAAYASWLLDLRAANEISRRTVLGQFDMDEDDEARMRQRERDSGLDDIFGTMAMPGAAPVNGDPAFNGPGGGTAAARAAGRRARGGGAAPGSGQGQAARRPGHESNPDTHAEAAAAGDTLLWDLQRPELIDLAGDLGVKNRHRMKVGDLRNEIRRKRIELLQADIAEDEEPEE